MRSFYSEGALSKQNKFLDAGLKPDPPEDKKLESLWILL